MDRRRFLELAGGAPLVWGLEDLLARRAPETPAWFDAARRRMAATGRWGVAIVVPENREDRLQMGFDLWKILEDAQASTLELFGEAVFICVDPDLAEGLLGRLDGANRVLLAPDGSRLDADSIAPDLLSDPVWFAASFETFLHGPRGERLRERAAAIGARLPADVPPAIARLESESIEERDRTERFLLQRAETIVPYLVQSRNDARPGETRARLSSILERCAAGGPRLPYGCTGPRTLVRDRMGCGTCGIAIVTEPARKFLGFSTK